MGGIDRQQTTVTVVTKGPKGDKGQQAYTNETPIDVLHLTASGNISSSGTIKAFEYILPFNSYFKAIDNSGNEQIVINNFAVGAITFGDEDSGIIIRGSALNFDSDRSNFIGNITASSDVSASSTISALNISAANQISASGQIHGSSIHSGNKLGLIYASATNTFLVSGANTKTTIQGTEINISTALTASGDISSSSTISALNISSSGDTHSTKFFSNQYKSGAGGSMLTPNTLYLNSIIAAFEDNADFTFGNGNYDTNLIGNNVWIGGAALGSQETPIYLAGNVTASGNISASGTVLAKDLSLESGEIDIKSGNSYTFNPSSGLGKITFSVGADNQTINSNKRLSITNTQNRLTLGGNITASGDISASGKLHGAGDNITFTNITASGDISASGQIRANDLFLYEGEFDITTGNTYTFNPSSGTGTLKIKTGPNNSTGIESTTELSLLSDANIINLGNSNKEHVTASANISASGTIFASQFNDDGTNLNVPDYVFESEYKLKSLLEIEKYISSSKHLPNIPSREDKEGWLKLSVGDRDMKLLEKIEELTLYIIDLQKQINELKK